MSEKKGGIRAVNASERLEYKKGESTIFYRRISSYEHGLIQKRHTRRGKPDWTEISREVMEYVVIGWEKIKEDEEKYLSFEKQHISALPQDDQMELLDLAGASDIAGHENKLKNLKTSSSGK